jgi:uncharacterized alpha-E superfamily protein
MLSRVAASFYWLSRYIERSDGIIRMLKINYATSQDAVDEFTWEPMLKLFSASEPKLIADMQSNSRAVLKYMVTDRYNQNSILNMVTFARENARSIQEHITRDLWQCLNEYYHVIKSPGFELKLQKDDPIGVLDILLKQIMVYYGTAEITMERGEGRSFMNIGKLVERSLQSIDILNIKFGAFDENPNLLTDTTYLKHLLLVLGGYELYLKTFREGIEPEYILEMMILNSDFPRSVLYSVNNIQRYFERLKTDSNASDYREMSFQIGRLQSSLQYSSVQSIMETGLAEYLKQVKDQLYSVGNSLNEHYFANS